MRLLDEKVRQDILDRLREAMSSHGIVNAPALAKVCGLKESTARAYLNGSRTPSLEACEKLGRCLGVGASWLYYGRGPKEGVRIVSTTPSELVFAAIEEAFLLLGITPLAAQAAAGVIQLIVDAHPRSPPGMSQQEAVRRLVRIQLIDILPPKDEG